MFKSNVTGYQHVSPIFHEYYQHHHNSNKTHHQFAKQHINMPKSREYTLCNSEDSLWIATLNIQAR